jgi:hypothetical protein
MKRMILLPAAGRSIELQALLFILKMLRCLDNAKACFSKALTRFRGENISEEEARYRLEGKVYDPVDNSPLEDPVEIVIDHPRLGIVYIMVNHRNMRQILLIFCRGKNYYSSSRVYQIRMNEEMPYDVRIVYADDGRVLVNTTFVHHLLTDQEVTIFGRYSGEVLPETVRTYPFYTDDARSIISDGDVASGKMFQPESDFNSASGSGQGTYGSYEEQCGSNGGSSNPH